MEKVGQCFGINIDCSCEKCAITCMSTDLKLWPTIGDVATYVGTSLGMSIFWKHSYEDKYYSILPRS